MRNQKGFTLVEMVLLIIWLAGVGVSVTLVYWIIRALMKYVGV